ncbi:alpha/beta hydrolase-fold protein [Hymenobacter sp. UYCo722]|uniref:alpha/beta hydrolase-fold protein n=1 Tax=Hymenobacter sp. UYCo722 TaxID=3156335 RepID=UPI003390CC19
MRATTLLLLLAAAPVGAALAQPATPSYDQLLQRTTAQVQARDYCAAVATFEQAFAPDSTRANEFELFGAASAAANCPAQRALAWRWLGQLSRHSLRMQPHDLDNVAQDLNLAVLKTDAAWPRWLAAMRAALASQAAAASARRAHWVAETQARALAWPGSGHRKTGRFAAAQPGFALYFSPVPNDTMRMPYLVRVPAGYSPARPAPVVVYLHGGVVSTTQFRFADPDVVQEPVFAAAPANAIVVYPFGRHTFGWVDQAAAFAQVEAIVREVQARYHTAPSGPVLGGMSNGGSAALWFASQRPVAFRGFYALSPSPKLPLRAGYGQLGQGKPCYQISAQDDDIYAYALVKNTHDARPATARLWELQAVPQGGHSFLYGPEGSAMLRQVLARLCARP